jgi:hypothetical protein
VSKGSRDGPTCPRGPTWSQGWQPTLQGPGTPTPIGPCLAHAATQRGNSRGNQTWGQVAPPIGRQPQLGRVQASDTPNPYIYRGEAQGHPNPGHHIRAAPSFFLYYSLSLAGSRRSCHQVIRVHISKSMLVTVLIGLDRGGNEYINHVVKMPPSYSSRV